MNGKATLLQAMAMILTMGASMNADAGLFGIGGTNWKEEVLLHDGKKIVVERWQKRGGRHEISSGPPVKEQSITFVLPGTSKTTTWRDEYSDEVGSANFELLALHVLDGNPYLVVTPYGCLAYNKWGRPNPPYVVFKHDGGTWQRITLTELPSALRSVNLVIDTSNNEKTLSKSNVVLVSDVQRLNLDYRQAEYRTILREPLPEKRISQMCEERVLYKGSWILPNDPVARQFIDQQR